MRLNGGTIRLVVAAVIATASVAFAQASPRQPKVLTPEQVKYQAEVAQWFTQRGILRTRAQNALSAETAREKAGDCPAVSQTRAAEICLESESEKTQANYTDFAGAIRAMLALAHPTMPGEQAVSGPTGMPPSSTELVAEFDRLEVAAKAYRDDAATAAYNQYRGGTLAPVFQMEAAQRLIRLHLQELAFIYGEELSNH